MELILAASASVIFAAGVYMLLSRHLLRMIFGVVLISGAANLIILLAGRLGATSPPIIPAGLDSLPEGAANPLPQALILTAIVIGFALTALLVAIAFRTWQAKGTLEAPEITEAEQLGCPFEPPRAEEGG